MVKTSFLGNKLERFSYKALRFGLIIEGEHDRGTVMCNTHVAFKILANTY